MIKVISSAPTDLFFPEDPSDPKNEKGITLKRGVNQFEIADLPPAVFRRFRVLHEDLQAVIETTEEIPSTKDGLATIPVTPPKPEPAPEAKPFDPHANDPKPEPRPVEPRPEIRPEPQHNRSNDPRK